jgi:nicotinamide mononucleotide transporter
MADLVTALAEAARALSPWEGAAVALAIAYLLLAIRQNVLCWPAAIASAAIYLALMFDAALYMQSGLQLFYMVMAGYGWWHWARGLDGGELPVTRWSARDHLLPLAGVLVLGGISGWLLSRHTDAAFPYLDALTAWGAIVTTWMVARKILQNWHWWFVIDAVLVYVYARQGLWLTAALFAFYLVLVVVGYRQWRASLTATLPEGATPA